MNRSHILFLLGCLVALSQTPVLRAAVIDFESLPVAMGGGTPTDDQFLNQPYDVAGGGTVRFFFDNNGNNVFDIGTDTRPVFEKYGPDANDGFSNGLLSLGDTANGGLAGQLGTYFLRQLQPGAPPPAFIVDYDSVPTIVGLHGEIWDIDGGPGQTEHWLVEILNSANAVIASQPSPLGNDQTLDGLPWVFSFSGLPAGVDKVRITFDGSKTSGLGLAFNNFDPLNPVPEPSSVVLAALGAALLVSRRAVRACGPRLFAARWPER